MQNFIGKGLTYNEVIQLDGAFDEHHKFYNKIPVFNAYHDDSSEEVKKDNCDTLPEEDTDVSKKELWKKYWLEYVYAFEKLSNILPNSIATVNIGRHAIELGMKYLLLAKDSKLRKIHNLKILSDELFKEYNLANRKEYEYMKRVDDYCEIYSNYIEKSFTEYFRYPEYKSDEIFKGNDLDIGWLVYNFALILLKLLHLAGLDKIAQETEKVS